MPRKDSPQARWNRENIVRVTIDLYKGKDADIIEWLDSLEPGIKQLSVRAALREHISGAQAARLHTYVDYIDDKMPKPLIGHDVTVSGKGAETLIEMLVDAYGLDDDDDDDDD